MSEERDTEVRIGNGDRMSGAVLFAFGAYAAYLALKMNFGTIVQPGPGFFPTLLAFLLMGASAVVLLRSLRPGAETASVGFGAHTGHLSVTIAAIVLYAAVLEAVGFVLCTFALVLMLLVGIGKVPWLRSLAVAGIGTMAFYVIFTQLGVPLPKGVLAF